MRNDDKRVQKTRSALRNALIHLMKTKSIDEITVKQLCLAANIQRSTFYCHYNLPLDILSEIEDEVIAEIKEIMPNPDDCTRRYTFILYEKAFEVFYRHPDLSWLLMGKHTDKKFSRKFAALLYEVLIKEWSSLYKLQNKAIMGYAFEFFAAGTLGVIHKWVCEGLNEKPAELAIIIQQFIVSGEQTILFNPSPATASTSL